MAMALLRCNQVHVLELYAVKEKLKIIYIIFNYPRMKFKFCMMRVLFSLKVYIKPEGVKACILLKNGIKSYIDNYTRASPYLQISIDTHASSWTQKFEFFWGVFEIRRSSTYSLKK